MKSQPAVRFAMCLVLGLAGVAGAQETAPGAPRAPRPPDDGALTVAILDFDAKGTAFPDLGKQIPALLTFTLSNERGIVLVERGALERIVREQELGMSGVVQAEQAIKVGKLLNARILITGNVIAVDDKHVWLLAKLIGTETSRVEATFVTGEKDDDPGSLLLKFSAKVAEHLREKGAVLVAGPTEPPDPIPLLKKRLLGRNLPGVAVHIAERDLTPDRPHAVEIDPAGETEFRKVLGECGFPVLDGDGRGGADAGGERILVTGEAFSAPGPRISNLSTATAQLEVKATNPATGLAVYNDRLTARAVDLSDPVAGKTAIQKGAHAAAIRLIEHLADTLPARPTHPPGAPVD